MGAERKRPSPDALLRQVQAEERQARRAKLKIFLGYASGVGKSHRMLDEGRRRKTRGQDVVVGAIQPSVSEDVEELLGQLEVIPPRMVSGSPVMDLDAILRRHPAVCIIDGLAYDNPPGSRHMKRWQDVEEILSSGISVVTSLNLQYVEEYREQVAQLTGKRVGTAVPVSFLHHADEIEIVDAPAAQAGHQVLLELRELALLLAADVVDRQLPAQWAAHERILVGITPRSDARRIIRSGQRNAARFHGELYVVYVRQPELSADDQQALDRNLAIAREANASIHVLEGDDPIEAIVEFSRSHGITQIFTGHSLRENWISRWFGDPIDRLIKSAKGIDIQIFPHTDAPR
jgi:two-component system sensor histidine kinase KdpD